jgi:hypothetical protein
MTSPTLVLLWVIVGCWVLALGVGALAVLSMRRTRQGVV